MEQYKEQMQEIINYGINNDFDVASLTPEMLKEMMRGWLKQNQAFYKMMDEAPVPVLKSLLNL